MLRQALKGQLADLRSKVDDPASFKEIYTFAFGYYKEETQKSIGEHGAEISLLRLAAAPYRCKCLLSCAQQAKKPRFLCGTCCLKAALHSDSHLSDQHLRGPAQFHCIYF